MTDQQIYDNLSPDDYATGQSIDIDEVILCDWSFHSYKEKYLVVRGRISGTQDYIESDVITEVETKVASGAMRCSSRCTEYTMVLED